MSAAPGDVTGPVTAIRRARLSAHDAAAVSGLGRDGLAEVRLDPAGMVAEVRPDSGRPVGDAELDLNGLLLLPAGAEPHTHLDKAIVWDVMNPEYGDLASGIRQWQAYAAGLTEDDFVRRGLSVAREFVANGVTAIRTHAEIFPTVDPGDDPLKSVRAMVTVREAMRPYCDIQVVVLPKNNIADDVIRRALEDGADLIGGSPHNTPDPTAELERLLALAREGGVGIDIHADERLDPSSLTVWEMAKDVLVSPLAGTVTAGHCTSLGLLSRDLLDPVAADLAAAGVGVIAAPITNLYLQGRDRPVATPRGITAVRALMEEGVLVAGAGDNVRDPINPVGAADAFTTASLMVSAAHLTIEEAYASVSEVARAIMGLPRAGVRVGDVADLVAVDSPTLASAVAGTAHDRVVLFRGRVVSERRSVLRTAF